jgi:hypothetical protein
MIRTGILLVGKREAEQPRQLRGGTNASRIENLGLAADDPGAIDQHDDLHTVPLPCLHRHKREVGQSLATGTAF